MKRAIMFAAILAGVLLADFVLFRAGSANAQDGRTIYDPDPNQLWNRLNVALFQRTAPDGKQYGLNELDILYWTGTTNLLAGPSHQQALSVLNEFINAHGERLIHDPLKKALLQRDLWALFDWVARPISRDHAQERRELESRLAVVIRRLELTTNEIASLPDNYALAETDDLPDLPHGLFQTNGDWINIRADLAELTVPMHVRFFGGRSVFTVWFRDADGRRAGMDYLKQLQAFKPMFVRTTNSESQEEIELNPALPQFPAHSQWALARRMCVIDTDGEIKPTHLVESIQLRTYLAIADAAVEMVTNRNGFVVPKPFPPQRFNEFRMTRDSRASLISLAQNAKDFDFVHFFSMGRDLFELRSETNYDSTAYQFKILGTCYECHTAPGIYSVNSFTRRLSGSPLVPPQISGSEPEREQEATLDWKEEQFDWGLLQGLWQGKN
ncbi:MAG TPA: hypothetical protein VMB22_01035 [Verrucomicrobiae bacterium]|nr:hypothetical protein [Verrucomicrobiae bacterium]